ncbi:hypothetical protein ACTXT7_008723 [Hymenolepis weldensis]
MLTGIADVSNLGGDDAFGMANHAVSGPVNAVNRVASDNALTTVRKGTWDTISNTTNTVGKVTGMEGGSSYNSSGNKSSYEFDGNGESTDYKGNPPKYSEVPEREYSTGKPNNKGEVEINREGYVSDGSFGPENGKGGNESKYSVTENMKMGSDDNEGNYKEKYEPQIGRSKSGFHYSHGRKDDYEAEVPVQKMGSRDRDGRRNKNQLDEVQMQVDQNKDRSRQYEYRMKNQRGRNQKDEQDPRDRYREDNTQMMASKGRFRGGIFGSRRDSNKKGLAASSFSSTFSSPLTSDSQSKFGFRLGGKMDEKEKKRFRWSKSNNKKNENVEFSAKKVCNAELEMVPCMVPKSKCNGGALCSSYGPSKCCSGFANFDAERESRLKNFYKKKCFVPKCVMETCGELKCCSGGRDAQFDEKYDHNGRFNRILNAGGLNGDFNGGLNSDFNGRMNGGFNGGFDHGPGVSRYYDEGVSIEQDIKPRKCRFSGSCDRRFDGNVNGGVNGGFKGGPNIGMNSRFQNGMNTTFNGRLNNGMTGEGFNMGMSNGMRMGASDNIADPMNGNMRGMNSFAATNGLSNSLNALNEALSGIVSKLPHLNPGIGMNFGGGMMPANGFSAGFGGMTNGGTMVSQGYFVGGQNSLMDPNFGGMGFGIQGNFGATSICDDKFGGYGGSLEEIRNVQGGCISPEIRYSSQPSDPLLNDQAGSLPPDGFHCCMRSNLNGTGLDDDEDYDIQYIEPDMTEYNRKVKEAEERAEQKRKELIRQRDEEVARKRAEMERQIEEEYERRKAEAERQRKAEIETRMLTQKLKAIRDAETEKRMKYERALAEAYQRCQPLKQQYAMAQLQMQELEAYKAQLQQQAKQIQTVSHVPAYESNASMEKDLLADFCQKMSAIKCQERKVLEEVANIPLPCVERPEMPEIPIPEIPEVCPEHVPMPKRQEIRVRKKRIQTPSPPPLMPTPLSTDLCSPCYVEIQPSRVEQQLPCILPPFQPQLQCPQPQSPNFCMRDSYSNDAHDTSRTRFQCACQVDGACLAHLVVCQTVVLDLDAAMPMVDAVVQENAANRQHAAVDRVNAFFPNAANRIVNAFCQRAAKRVVYLGVAPNLYQILGNGTLLAISALNCCDAPSKCCKPGGSCGPLKCCKPTGTKDNCSNDNGCEDTSKCEPKKKCEEKKKSEEMENFEEKVAKRPQSAASRLFSRRCVKKSEENAEFKVSTDGTDEGKANTK